MTSSTSRCEPGAPLLGCGTDCEASARFARLLAGDAHPLPFVFTRAEIDRARALPDPPRALAFCFCAKEAVFKALSAPLDFTDCELILTADDRAELRLAPALCAEHGIGSWTIELRDVAEADGVVMAVVYLFASPTAR
jgi:phosphopantetheinyl transferase (holo-ACP synthase)